MSPRIGSLVLALVLSIGLYKQALAQQTPLRVTQTNFDEIAPAWNPANESIAYLLSQFGIGLPYDIFFTDSSGSFAAPLFQGPAIDLGPAFSPAWIGTTGFLACYESINVPEFLFLNTLNAPIVKSVLDGPEATYFSAVEARFGNQGGFIKFSRDGSTFIVRELDAFGGANLRSASIFDVLFSPLLPLELSSFGVVQLNAAPGTGNFFDQGVALAPDGSGFIAAIPLFTSNGPHDLFFFSTDASTQPRNLTNTAALGVWNVAPDFSPDGTGVVFSRWTGVAGESFELFGLDPDGTITQLTDTPFFDEYAPNWAPDGLRIAYQGRHFDGFESSEPALFAGEAANWNIYVLQVRTIRIVNPAITPNLPVVETEEKKAKVTAEKFKGATLSKKKGSNALIPAGLRQSLMRKKGGSKLPFRYMFKLERTDVTGAEAKRSRKRKLSRRNTVTFNKLAPGTYKASYRVQIMKSKNSPSRGKLSKSSPVSTFQIR